jgi:hypothetical protein
MVELLNSPLPENTLHWVAIIKKMGSMPVMGLISAGINARRISPAISIKIA